MASMLEVQHKHCRVAICLKPVVCNSNESEVNPEGTNWKSRFRVFHISGRPQTPVLHKLASISFAPINSDLNRGNYRVSACIGWFSQVFFLAGAGLGRSKSIAKACMDIYMNI